MKANGYVQKGDKLDWINMSNSDIPVMTVIPMGDYLLIAAESIAIGAIGGVYKTGVFDFPAISNAAMNIGDRVYWDNTAGKITNAPIAGNTPAGIVTSAKSYSSTRVSVSLERGKVYFAELRPMENRCKYTKIALTDGTVTAGTARLAHSALVDCFDLRLVYANAYTSAGGGTTEPLDLPGANDIAVSGSIEYGSTIYRGLFKGAKKITISPGAFITSDRIGISLKKGDTFYSRTYGDVSPAVITTANGKFPYGTTTDNNVEGFIADQDLTGVTTAITKSSTSVFAPVAILANTSSNNGNVAILGDSIGAGYNGSWFSTGYMELALKDAGMSYINIARSAEKVSLWVNQPNSQYRKLMLEYCDAAIVNYGINDINDSSLSADTIIANMQKCWQDLLNRGIKKIFQCTITPKALSGNVVDPVGNPKRIIINNYIRSCPWPLTGYFEIADLAETARDSGVWKTGYSTDLLHPNDTGYPALKLGIDASKLR